MVIKNQLQKKQMKKSRNQMMKILEDKYKFEFVRTSEEFSGSTDGIWLSGENGEELGGQAIYDYYTSNYHDYEIGVLSKFARQIEKLGWYSQWYDCGTIMLYPINF